MKCVHLLKKAASTFLGTLRRLRVQDLSLLSFAIGIGVLAAGGALLFRTLIELFQGLFWFQGHSFMDQVANTPWWLVVSIPVLGGLIAGPIITFLVPEARGPGVPEVIMAVSARQSVIRHRVTFLKALVTSLLLGTGASVGREGPIVQIGSSVGSSLAQVFNLNPELRRLCLACGAAAGISATFNAPIAGSMFAMEIILMNVEVSYMSYIVIAAITGSVLSRIFWGDLPAFMVIPFAMESYWELSVYLLLGISAGLLSIGFVRLLFSIDGLFSRSPVPDWLTPALGGAVLGCLALALPQVLGVGYETVNAALTDNLTLKMAVILLAAKLVATAVCIGSGMSGGIFAPSLFLGAVLGTAVGFGAEAVWPEFAGNPAFYALAGMGAVVSGTTLAPITAIVTIFELTLHYQVILPLMAACITATLVVRFLFGYSAYELKLLKRGVNLVRGHDVAILRNIQVKDVMRKNMDTVAASSTLEEVMERVLKSSFPHFVVLDDQRALAGILSLRDLRRFLVRYDELKSTTTVQDMMSTSVVTLTAWDTMEKALQLFEEHRFSMVPVVGWDSKKVQGIMLKDDLLKAYDERVLRDRVLSIAKK